MGTHTTLMNASLNNTFFSGSYPAEDVQFLLRPLALDTTPVAEKERLIQSGERHYSEMISEELPPSPAHQSLFASTLASGAARMGREVDALALALMQQVKARPIVLVSFVRAGVPLGVLLRRALQDHGVEAVHYGISIIRDRGLDAAAVDHILAAHGSEGLVWVDGWTGKGAIAGELQRSLAGDTRFAGEPRLVTLADPCGRAWLAASGDDWLIPSGILGATVSGLVSRSIYTQDGGWHGCVHCDHLREHDTTCLLVDQVDAARRQQPASEAAFWPMDQRQALQRASDQVIDRLAGQYGITNRNRIKPGIAEATRAVLRRVPDAILVRDKQDPDVQLLAHLSASRDIVLEEVGDCLGPYRAVTLIKRIA